MHADEDGFAATRPGDAERVDRAIREEGLTGRDRRPDLGEVEARREAVAAREEEADAQVGVLVEAGIGACQVGEHRDRERVLLLGAVEGDDEDVAVDVGRDAHPGTPFWGESAW